MLRRAQRFKHSPGRRGECWVRRITGRRLCDAIIIWNEGSTGTWDPEWAGLMHTTGQPHQARIRATAMEFGELLLGRLESQGKVSMLSTTQQAQRQPRPAQQPRTMGRPRQDLVVARVLSALLPTADAAGKSFDSKSFENRLGAG